MSKKPKALTAEQMVAQHNARIDVRSRAHIEHLKGVIASIPDHLPTAATTRAILQADIDGLQASLSAPKKGKKR